MTSDLAANAELFRALEGISKTDFPSHLKEALADGRSLLSVLREVIAADKLLLQSLLRSMDLPVPELLAITHPERTAPNASTVAGAPEITRFLRETRN